MALQPVTPPADGYLVPDRDDEKITIREAAALCGVDYDTFLSWVRKGAVPYVIVGPYHIKRVFRRDVEGMIKPGPVV